MCRDCDESGGQPGDFDTHRTQQIVATQRSPDHPCRADQHGEQQQQAGQTRFDPDLQIVIVREITAAGVLRRAVRRPDERIQTEPDTPERGLLEQQAPGLPPDREPPGAGAVNILKGFRHPAEQRTAPAEVGQQKGERHQTSVNREPLSRNMPCRHDKQHRRTDKEREYPPRLRVSIRPYTSNRKENPSNTVSRVSCRRPLLRVLPLRHLLLPVGRRPFATYSHPPAGPSTSARRPVC